jgi:hypothetical protein
MAIRRFLCGSSLFVVFIKLKLCLLAYTLSTKETRNYLADKIHKNNAPLLLFSVRFACLQMIRELHDCQLLSVRRGGTDVQVLEVKTTTENFPLVW